MRLLDVQIKRHQYVEHARGCCLDGSHHCTKTNAERRRASSVLKMGRATWETIALFIFNYFHPHHGQL